MALTANRDVDHYIDQELRTLGVATNKHVFKGAIVGLATSGYAQPLVAGDAFVGIAYEDVDNTGGANGAKSIRVYTLGDFGHALTGATAADISRPVFASADDTLVFTAAGNSFAGIVQDFVAAGQVIVRILPVGRRLRTVSYAVEDLAAGADIAARALHAFEKEAWIVSARLLNQGTAAAGINDANTCVITLVVGGLTVASKTFNTSTPFPAVNTAVDLGSISNARVSAGGVLTVAVTNGATADPGPFLAQVDFI